MMKTGPPNVLLEKYISWRNCRMEQPIHDSDNEISDTINKSLVYCYDAVAY